jgi:ABC-type cobalamin/Fe3+-siderophores transport system ATPase subunit
MTLLLGPPSSGKTSLLLALAGKLDKDLKVINYSHQSIYAYHCHYHCFSNLFSFPPRFFLKSFYAHHFEMKLLKVWLADVLAYVFSLS